MAQASAYRPDLVSMGVDGSTMASGCRIDSAHCKAGNRCRLGVEGCYTIECSFCRPASNFCGRAVVRAAKSEIERMAGLRTICSHISVTVRGGKIPEMAFAGYTLFS